MLRNLQSATKLRLVDNTKKPSSKPVTLALEFTAEELAARADALEDRRQAVNTQRAYRASWEHFCEWCTAAAVRNEETGLMETRCALPASVETIRLYLADHSAGPKLLTAATLRLRLAAITRKHREAGLEPPSRSDAANRVMAGLARAQVDEGIIPVQKRWLKTDEVVSAVLRLPSDSSRIAIRNRCILLLGFAGGFRRSEIVALNIADIEIVERGMLVSIRRSKTDQLGKGKSKAVPYGTRGPESCPVLAYKGWLAELEAAGKKRGPLFYGMPHHDKIGPNRLRGEAIGDIVKQAVVAIGLDADKYAGHSLRSGLVTSALIGGADRADVKQMTGHKSDAAFEVYVRELNLFDRNAATSAGL